VQKRLDDAFLRAVDDEEVRVIILAGAGQHSRTAMTSAARRRWSEQKKPRSSSGSSRDEYRRLWAEAIIREHHALASRHAQAPIAKYRATAIMGRA